MSKRLVFVLFALAAVLLAGPLFAQEHGDAGGTSGGGNPWAPFAPGITIAIAAIGGAVSQGRAVAAACDAMGRNPGSAGNVRFITILGLALIESLVIYAFVIAFFVLPK